MGTDDEVTSEAATGQAGRRRRWPWLVAGALVSLLVVAASQFGPLAFAVVVAVAVVFGMLALVRPSQRATAGRIAGVAASAGALTLVVMVVGVPGLRPSSGELHRVAAKINDGCRTPGAPADAATGPASVDVWRGGLVVEAAPGPGPYELTPDERRLIVAGYAVMCVPGPIR